MGMIGTVSCLIISTFQFHAICLKCLHVPFETLAFIICGWLTFALTLFLNNKMLKLTFKALNKNTSLWHVSNSLHCIRNEKTSAWESNPRPNMHFNISKKKLNKFNHCKTISFTNIFLQTGIKRIVIFFALYTVCNTAKLFHLNTFFYKS